MRIDADDIPSLASNLELNLTADLFKRLTALGITEFYGFSRLGEAKEKHVLFDTNIGCYAVINGERKDIEFDQHAHLPHYLPNISMFVVGEAVVCNVDPSEVFQLLSNPEDVEGFVYDSVKFWIDCAVSVLENAAA